MRQLTYIVSTILATFVLAYFFLVRDEIAKEQGMFPAELADFQLEDMEGKGFTPSELKNQWSILFFGYTSCPDICPAHLTMLDQTLAGYLPVKYHVNPRIIFVSVDPDRDSAPLLQSYLGYFSSTIQGVTGSHRELTKMLRPLATTYEIEPHEKGGPYKVLHPVGLYVVAPTGKVVGVLKDFKSPTEIISGYNAMVNLNEKGQLPSSSAS